MPATIGCYSLASSYQPGNEGNCTKDQRVELLQRSKCIRCQYFIIQSYFPSSPNMKAIKGGKKTHTHTAPESAIVKTKN